MVVPTATATASGEILTKHIGVADLRPVLPGFDNNPRRFPGLIKT
jgi:hypothetical protein